MATGAGGEPLWLSLFPACWCDREGREKHSQLRPEKPCQAAGGRGFDSRHLHDRETAARPLQGPGSVTSRTAPAASPGVCRAIEQGAYRGRVPTASTTLPGLSSSVPTARRFAESVLSGWGLGDAGWTAAQVVSELATNCVLHARTGFTVTVTVAGPLVRIEVRDGSAVGVQPRSHSATSTTGRGLRMVQTLTADWGVIGHEHGKTVWSVLPAADRSNGHDDDVDTLLAAFDDVEAAVPLPRAGRPPEATARSAA